MYEDRPERDTPQYILDDLREYGGVSPDGQPLWRLVLAQNCRIHCFGRVNHIPEGMASRLGEDSSPLDVVPDRTEEGEFWIPRTKIKGWILQRWFPASTWGSRQRWESEKAQDGRTQLLAAFPNRGDYLMMPIGPWKSIAEVGDLKAAIRCYNAQQRANPKNWVNVELAFTAMEAQERQQQADAYAEELESQFRMTFSPLLRTVSGNAQAVRNLVAQEVGGVNLSAAEKWG